MKTVDEIVIQPGKAVHYYWRDLWNYRELFYFLAWRDILVRYKQTVIGLSWSILRPLLTMIIFTVVFGTIAKLPSDGVPYPILVFVAMIPWQYFSNTLTESSNSLLGNANMLTKVYFPRLIIPASAMIVGVVDFLISLVILAGIMIWYQFIPDWRIIFLPLFFILATLTALGAGLLLGALNVAYRDFRIIVPFLVQFGLYISPVGFSSTIVPDQWRFLYSLNPMVGVIDGFRWSILGPESQIFWSGFWLSVGIALIIFILGIWYFRKMERSFADII